MHPDFKDADAILRPMNRANPLEEEIQYWHGNAQQYLRSKIAVEKALNENQAKNVILFLGDGMSLATVAASRMYMGGEEKTLSFEEFPHFGLSKVFEDYNCMP